MERIHWTKQYAGFYTLDGTDMAVAASYDGVAADEFDTNFVGRVEWAVVQGAKPNDHNAGSNVSWHDTMSEARNAAERLVQR